LEKNYNYMILMRRWILILAAVYALSISNICQTVTGGSFIVRPALASESTIKYSDDPWTALSIKEDIYPQIDSDAENLAPK
jgi:hypothetical protein